jgi:sugar phosphate isomerase/epimerase
MSQIPIALQLYSLRDNIAKDFVSTLKQVATIGYPAVELASVGHLSAKEIKTALDDLGLKVAGNHVAMDLMEKDLSRVFDDNHTLDNTYLVVPWLPESRRKSAQDWIDFARVMNTLGTKCQAEGFQLVYHNHNFEFQKFDGRTGFDLVFGNTDPKLVQSELDVYWAHHAGHDPAALIRQYAGRVPLVHLKDMTKGTPPTFAEVGEGIIDFTPIFRASEASGVKWYVVEQDTSQRTPLESVAISWRNLQNMQR